MKLLNQFVKAMLPQMRSDFRRMGRKDQVQFIVDTFGKRHLSKEKDVGWRTKRDRATVVHAAVSVLKVDNILNVGQKHISIIIDVWAKKGIEPSTFQTRLSHLRWFAACIGKAGLVRDVTYYGHPASLTERTYVAKATKSWDGNGIDAATKIVEVEREDAYVGCQLEGQFVFGLRSTESMLVRPAENVEGNSLIVKYGTKGGRTRVIPIESELQRAWLRKAEQLAAQTERGNLVPAGMTYDQARNRRNYVVRKHGLSKAALGVVPHGLRAQYAEARYQEVSGTAAPTRGGGTVATEVDEAARREVSRQLGHSRTAIASAYIGARPTENSGSGLCNPSA